MRATSSVPSLGTMYFFAMESAWPLTAVAKARRGASPSGLMRGEGAGGKIGSNGNLFFFRGGITRGSGCPVGEGVLSKEIGRGGAEFGELSFQGGAFLLGLGNLGDEPEE